MGVEKPGEKYRCEECGNEVKAEEAGYGTLYCCEKPMKKISD